MIRLLLSCLILIAAAARAQPADDAALLLKTAAHLLGFGEAGSPDGAEHWEPIHAVEGDGLMLRGVIPEVCAAAETQSARTAIRLQASCHRDGATSTLIIFLAQ